MTEYRCQGKCGRIVAGPDKYCFICWADAKDIETGMVPIQRTREGELLRLRIDILNQANRFFFCPKEDRNYELDKLVHLGHVLQHEQAKENENEG